MHVRLCPNCGAAEVHRSRRRGVFEHILLRMVSRRPYRCFACGARFYDHRRPVKVKKQEQTRA